MQQKDQWHVQESDKNTDIESIRQQACEGGLRFEVYLPPRLAEWVIALVDQDVFHSPSEAVFVAMQSFRDLDEYPDLKQELLKPDFDTYRYMRTIRDYKSSGCAVMRK